MTSSPFYQQPKRSSKPGQTGFDRLFDPIFKSETSARAEEQPVLGPFISQRTPPSAFSKPTQSEAGKPNILAASAKGGFHLNQVDTQMNAGIEGYLPTPGIRLRVIRERLNDEIGVLAQRLREYEKIRNRHTPELVDKITRLRERLGVLQAHHEQVSEQLKTLHAGVSVFRLSTSWQGFRRQLDQTASQAFEQLSPAKLLHGAESEPALLARLNDHLNSLSHVLDEQMRQPIPSHQQISEIVNQYDKLIQRVEQLAETLRQRRSWREKLNDRIFSLYRRWIAL